MPLPNKSRKGFSMKQFRLTAAVIAICLLLSACNTLNLNTSGLMSPPRAEGNQARILSLIDENAGGNYTLIYPASGEYKSAVIFRDLDGSGEDEAVALYRSADNVTHILFASRSGDSYTAIGEGTFTGSIIERVDFVDLDSDGCEELITCYPDGSSPLSTLSVMYAGDSVTQTNLPTCCTTYLPGDYDGDGTGDLLLLTLPSTVGPASARLITCIQGDFGEKAACSMDDSVSELCCLSFGNIGEGTVGAVVDGRSAQGEYTTQILYYDTATHSLMNPLFVYGGYQDTRRPTAIMSGDIDSDGTIEIPICSLMDYAADEDVSSVCRKVTWNRFSPSAMSLAFQKTAVLCENLGFLLNLSGERTGAVTARYTGENSVTFYEWSYRDGEPDRGDEVLTIRRYDKESYDSSRIFEAVLCETNTVVYTYTLTDSERSYTPDEVAAAFVLTS